MSYPQPQLAKFYAGHYWLVLFCSVIALFGIFGELFNPILAYQRVAIIDGQWWRLLSGHLVHLGLVHTGMNLLGLVLIIQLFRGIISTRLWWLAGAGQCVLISTGFILFNPELESYAGLSGLVHGFLVMALVIAFWEAKQFHRGVAVIMIAAVAAKLAYERLPAYSADYLQAYMEAPVIVDAHLYGAVAGLAMGIGYGGWRYCINLSKRF